ncbi:MAG: hypothetical protein LBH53_03675 [Puniceicoccales bacterium]|nr:hypothetical protein [Puniceicoccales bacterium]
METSFSIISALRFFLLGLSPLLHNPAYGASWGNNRNVAPSPVASVESGFSFDLTNALWLGSQAIGGAAEWAIPTEEGVFFSAFGGSDGNIFRKKRLSVTLGVNPSAISASFVSNRSIAVDNILNAIPSTAVEISLKPSAARSYGCIGGRTWDLAGNPAAPLSLTLAAGFGKSSAKLEDLGVSLGGDTNLMPVAKTLLPTILDLVAGNNDIHPALIGTFLGAALDSNFHAHQTGAVGKIAIAKKWTTSGSLRRSVATNFRGQMGNITVQYGLGSLDLASARSTIENELITTYAPVIFESDMPTHNNISQLREEIKSWIADPSSQEQRDIRSSAKILLRNLNLLDGLEASDLSFLSALPGTRSSYHVGHAGLEGEMDLAKIYSAVRLGPSLSLDVEQWKSDLNGLGLSISLVGLKQVRWTAMPGLQCQIGTPKGRVHATGRIGYRVPIATRTDFSGLTAIVLPTLRAVANCMVSLNEENQVGNILSAIDFPASTDALKTKQSDTVEATLSICGNITRNWKVNGSLGGIFCSDYKIASGSLAIACDF